MKDDAAFAKYINDHVAFKAAEDSRRATLPAKPEDYKATTTPAFKPPQGMEWKLNEQDPLLGTARTYAQKHGLSQDGFSELMDLYAASQVQTLQQIETSKAAELQKLGATATSRADSVTTWLKAQMGEDLAKEMTKFLFTAKQFEGFEKIIAAFRTQGASSYTPQHSESTPQKLSDEEYNKLSFGERRAYAAQFGNPTLSPSQANGR